MARYTNLNPVEFLEDLFENCLNEFCYKFNRRYFGDALFDRLMVAALAYKNGFS